MCVTTDVDVFATMTTVLQTPPHGAGHFSSSPIHSASYPDLASLNTSISYPGRNDAESSYLNAGYDGTHPNSAPSSAPSSPQLTHSSFSRQESYASTPASSISLDQRLMDEDDYGSDFPLFENSGIYDKPSSLPLPTSPKAYQPEVRLPDGEYQSDLRLPNEEFHSDPTPPTPPTPSTVDTLDLTGAVNDDQAIEPEPTRHVDYLAHEWKEEDIWSSWSYIVHRRKIINNSVRLENASWRTWTKAQNNLKTVSPEALNWLKDCDVTWLYGPLQTDTKSSLRSNISPLPSRLSHSASFVAKKKPILKKKTASAAILERSRSQHSLLQRAGDIIRIQQSSPAHGRPSFSRGHSEFALPRYTGSSVANTPAEHDAFFSGKVGFEHPEVQTPSECRHVEFNEEVEQVQAIESEDDEKDLDPVLYSEDDTDDDCGLMMAPSKARSTPRSSFSNDGKTIAPLPSTKLKYRKDTPEPREPPSQQNGVWPTHKLLSPSPSQETLRPSRPSHNFLIDDDPEISDEPWSSWGTPSESSPYAPEDENRPNMRRTESGMFMPYDDSEEEAVMNSTLFGQAMYAVNTFKDIAHVVWNVGWNRK